MPKFFYDLTELFYQMNAKVPYYGIAKTVMEVGYELAKLDQDIEFVLFSPGHQRFLKVDVSLDDPTGGGVLRPNMPHKVAPTRLRRSQAHNSALWFRLHSLLRVRQERAKWRALPDDQIRPVNLDGQLLISLSQPRIISDFHFALHQRGESVTVLPLLHDLIPLHSDAKRKFNRTFLQDNCYILQHCKNVIANSAFTRAEILVFAQRGVVPNPNQVFALPLAHEFRAQVPSVSPDIPHKGYFLTVGSMPGRKNLETILDAMQLIQTKGGRMPKLVIAGAKRKRIPKLLDQSYPGLNDHVAFEISPSPVRLEALYRKALGTILPSFIEGWGLPAAESLWLDRPAIAADIPVLREVLGEAGVFFDPHRPEELAKKMTALAEDAGYTTRVMLQITKARPALRSWKQVAQDLIAIAEKARP